MSETAVEPVESQGHPRERNEARAAILDAARRVVAREGVEGTSLGAVADDAGVARAAVYAQFRSKNDLLLSIVADDMNLLARAMREASGLPAYKPPTPKHIVRFDTAQMEQFRKDAAERSRKVDDETVLEVEPDAAVESEAASFVEAPAALQEPTTHDGAHVDVESNEGGAPESPVLLRKEDPDEAAPESAKPLEQRLPTREERIRLIGKRVLATPELKETIKKLVPAHSPDSESPADTIERLREAVAKLESGAADRIERRVHVLERTLASLEGRYEQLEQSHKAAVAAAQEAATKALARIEETEKSLRESILKMMPEIRDAARRIDEFEFAQKSARKEAELAAAPVESEPKAVTLDEDAPRVAALEQSEPPTPADDDASEQASADSDDAQKASADTRADDGAVDRDRAEPADAEERPSYLSAARRAALSAAMKAQENGAVESARKARLTRNLMAGVAGLAVVLVGSGIALSHIEAGRPDAATPHGAARAVEHVTHAHRATLPKKQIVAASAPLDRLTALANAGNAQAELLVGLKYALGDGIPRNDAEAEKWISRAAGQGQPVAEYWMGTIYEHGRGVVADPATSLAWYEKAALHGNRKAMHNVAIAYAEGKGVAKDYMQAAQWFSRAAQLGYLDSEFNLAVLYERGDGVPQSLLDAYKWYAIAARQGDAESKSRMGAIETQLSPDDLAAAQKAATEFTPEPARPEANDVPKEVTLTSR